MSAPQSIRTGNVVAVFHSGFARSRAGCSCGWEGDTRMLPGWALIDAYTHAAHCWHCQPALPLIVDERAEQGWWRRLTPWPVAVAWLLVLIPAALWGPEWLQALQ